MKRRVFRVTKKNYSHAIGAVGRLVWSMIDVSEIDVSVEKAKDGMTLGQRGKFHSMLNELASAIGYTPDELKHWLKVETFGEHEVTLNDRAIMAVKSSEAADRDEYSALIETTYRIAADLGVSLR